MPNILFEKNTTYVCILQTKGPTYVKKTIILRKFLLIYKEFHQQTDC